MIKTNISNIDDSNIFKKLWQYYNINYIVYKFSYFHRKDCLFKNRYASIVPFESSVNYTHNVFQSTDNINFIFLNIQNKK